MDNAVLWSLLLMQIAMGGIDTIWHHEFTERLAWRQSQREELRLHGMRNLLYGVFFLVMGFGALHGAFAVGLMLVLGVEIIITLIDFVEEDRTRKLPWTERILHTLMTLSYGVLLALLAPVLLDWAGQPTGAVFAFHGVFSLLMVPAVIGVCLFGLKDLQAAKRLGRMVAPDPAALGRGLTGRRRVLVTGGTGFIGARLVPTLLACGHDVTLLVRDAQKGAKLGAPVRLVTKLDQIADDEAFDVVINLAGAPIVGGLWTRARRRHLLRSRLVVTRDVSKLIARLAQKPACLIHGSAIGIYGLRDDAPLTEEEAIVADGSFSHRLCASWEAAGLRAQRFGVRVVPLRTGLVLDSEGGMLANMLFAFEFFLGGHFGHGQQWMSWISRDDLVRMIFHAISREEIDGPLNATAPEPVRGARFAAALGRALGRPAALPVPSFVLALAGDLGREIFLSGQRVLPTRALQTGFIFDDPSLQPCLDRLVGRAVLVPKPHAFARLRTGGA